MPLINAPVGKNGRNDKSDVALIQAALAATRTSDRKPWWSGPVDGDWSRHRAALEQAIADFQAAGKLQVTGLFDTGGPAISRLVQALPQGLRSMRAVKGTPVLYTVSSAGVIGKPDGGIKALGLPNNLTADLLAVRSEVMKVVPFLLFFDTDTVVGDGKARVTFGFLNVRFLDARLQPTKVLPKEVASLVRAAVRRSQHFLVTQAAEGVILTSKKTMFFRKAVFTQPAPGPVIAKTVGPDADNDPEDVRAVQATLSCIQKPDGSGMFWTGSCSGDFSNDLGAAIQGFKIAARLPPSVRVTKGGKEDKAMGALLPASMKTRENFEKDLFRGCPR